MPALTHRTFAYVLLALLVAFAGCSGDGSGGAGGGDQGAASSGGQEQVTTAGAGAAPTNGQQAAAMANSQVALQERQRALIRTGKVALEVDNFTRARSRLVRVVQQSNGFISDSQERVHQEENETWRTGRLVFRVPKDNFTGVFEAIKGAGKVRTATTSTEDVTKQLVDIEARLRNLRAQRDRLRQLFRGANETEDLLAVQKRLSAVQSRIERLEGQRRTLTRQVALSTIVVDLSEPVPDPVRKDTWYDVGIVAAFLSSIEGVVTTLRALVVGLAYVVPYVLVFGVPTTAVVYVVWSRR